VRRHRRCRLRFPAGSRATERGGSREPDGQAAWASSDYAVVGSLVAPSEYLEAVVTLR
jgi:hypothetical protein